MEGCDEDDGGLTEGTPELGVGYEGGSWMVLVVGIRVQTGVSITQRSSYLERVVWKGTQRLLDMCRRMITDHVGFSEREREEPKLASVWTIHRERRRQFQRQ